MTKFIDLHRRGKGVVARAKVSSDDYAHLSQFKWYLFKNGNFFYGRRTWIENGRQRSIYLHQEIMGINPGFVIDHRNRDTLDNQRCNLRWANKSQNAHNSERKGVYFCPRRKRFFAHCRVNGIRHSLGGYEIREDAEDAVVRFRQDRRLAV